MPDEQTKALFDAFMAAFNQKEALKPLLAGWDRIFLVEITDRSEQIPLHLGDHGIRLAPPGRPADIVFTADGATIQKIFSGEENPGLALAMGTLQVQGSPENLMKLQAISSLLWE